MIIVPSKRPERWARVEAMARAQTVREPLVFIGDDYTTIGAARNAGLDRARQETFAYFWDDDNYYGPRYIETMRAGFASGASVVSQGIAFVRFDDGLYLFDTRRAGSFYPGHCTAVRVADAAPFPESSGWEDVEWSKRMQARGAAVAWAAPWHAVYDRRGTDHVCGLSRVEFLRCFGGALKVSGPGVPRDCYVDVPREVIGTRVTASDDEIFAALRMRAGVQ